MSCRTEEGETGGAAVAGRLAMLRASAHAERVADRELAPRLAELLAAAPFPALLLAAAPFLAALPAAALFGDLEARDSPSTAPRSSCIPGPTPSQIH